MIRRRLESGSTIAWSNSYASFAHRKLLVCIHNSIVHAVLYTICFITQTGITLVQCSKRVSLIEPKMFVKSFMTIQNKRTKIGHCTTAARLQLKCNHISSNFRKKPFSELCIYKPLMQLFNHAWTQCHSNRPNFRGRTVENHLHVLNAVVSLVWSGAKWIAEKR